MQGQRDWGPGSGGGASREEGAGPRKASQGSTQGGSSQRGGAAAAASTLSWDLAWVRAAASSASSAARRKPPGSCRKLPSARAAAVGGARAEGRGGEGFGGMAGGEVFCGWGGERKGGGWFVSSDVSIPPAFPSLLPSGLCGAQGADTHPEEDEEEAAAATAAPSGRVDQELVFKKADFARMHVAGQFNLGFILARWVLGGERGMKGRRKRGGGWRAGVCHQPEP